MTKEIRYTDIIIPSYFLGNTLSYALYFKGSVVLEANENYQKRSCRNKCYIKTSQGAKAISVPLRSGKNQQQSIREVRISYEENWVKDFKQTIETNYSASPYLRYYQSGIEKIIDKKPELLWDLNWELNHLILHYLGIETDPKVSGSWNAEYDKSTLDLRSKELNLKQEYQYPQLFKEKGLDFIENLSIIDLLFCCGPEARLHLKNIAEHMNV